MFTKEQLSEKIETYLTGLRFADSPESLYAPITYCIESGGKRLRPMLVLLSCNVFSDDVDKALPCAGAIEMFHNFTLLHDDIMDNADIRRGRSSVHKKWNRNIAILSGDAMVIYSYQLLQQTPDEILNPVLKEFNTLALQVCEGQQYDIDFETMDTVSLDQYMEMIRLKTAVLMAGAMKIGALVGGADEKSADILYRYGIELGLAYQLQDDYLDTYGTAEVLGKNIGGDIAESKKTFLMINALRDAGDATRRALLATLTDDNHPLSQKINRVRTIYNSLDIPEITRKAVSEHLSKAAEALASLDVPAEKKQPLENILEILHNRNN